MSLTGRSSRLTSHKSLGLTRRQNKHTRSAAGTKGVKEGEEEPVDNVDQQQVLELESKVLDLQKQLEAEKRRSSVLESELSISLATSQRAEGAHQEEVANMEADVMQVTAERRSLIEKLQQIEVVEDAIRDLYVQMKDRIAEDEPSVERLQEEKMALKKENIFVVLGALHATLQNLWAFKVDAEDDLRGIRQTRANDHLKQIEGLKESLRARDTDSHELQRRLEAAELRLHDEIASKERLLEESQSIARDMESKHCELVETLKKTEFESERLRQCLTLAREEGRKRDGLVLRNKQLESARHFDRLAQDRELRQMRYEHESNMGKRSMSQSRYEEACDTIQRLQLEIDGKIIKEKELTTKLKALEGKVALQSPKKRPASAVILRRSGSGAECNKDKLEACSDDGVLADVESMRRLAKSGLRSFKETLRKEPFLY
ncbi:hypothetical protein BSKO_10920 [Bryopsis sp. KO-2023]|nr:hypothetical protein BSKO_10920 [Bryopsis sp. KO-2023]